MKDSVHLFILTAIMVVLHTEPLPETVQHLLVTDQDQEDQNSLGEETMIRNWLWDIYMILQQTGSQDPEKGEHKKFHQTHVLLLKL